jgi:hypothetical protein
MTKIYALVDPHTSQVRYVGRTTQTVTQRLAHHIGAAKRGKNKHPVYAWIRSLQPAQPLIVILRDEINTSSVIKRPRGWTSIAEHEETKWKKRLERSPLLCVVPRSSQNYRALVNTKPEVTR